MKMSDMDWIKKRLNIEKFDFRDMNDFLLFINWFRDWIDATDSTWKNFSMESTGRLIEAKRDGWHIPEFQISVIRKYVEFIEGNHLTKSV